MTISQEWVGRPINFVFDSSCLLSAASEPHRLPACHCHLFYHLLT